MKIIIKLLVSVIIANPVTSLIANSLNNLIKKDLTMCVQYVSVCNNPVDVPEHH